MREKLEDLLVQHAAPRGRGELLCETLYDMPVPLLATGDSGELHSTTEQEAVTVQLAASGGSGELQLETPRQA